MIVCVDREDALNADGGIGADSTLTYILMLTKKRNKLLLSGPYRRDYDV